MRLTYSSLCYASGIILATSPSQSSFAMEQGYYELFKNTPKFEEIMSAKKQADLELLCGAENEFRIYRPKCKILSQSDLADLSKLQAKKNLLFIWFHNNSGPTLLPYTDKRVEILQARISRMEPFLRSLGYERILMVNASTNSMRAGFYVLQDWSSQK